MPLVTLEHTVMHGPRRSLQVDFRRKSAQRRGRQAGSASQGPAHTTWINRADRQTLPANCDGVLHRLIRAISHA